MLPWLPWLPWFLLRMVRDAASNFAARRVLDAVSVPVLAERSAMRCIALHVLPFALRDWRRARRVVVKLVGMIAL